MTYTLHGEPIEVGDRVWSVVEGWGEIVGIAERPYPLRIKFENGTNEYLEDGRLFDYADSYTALYWDEVKITPPPKPKKKVKKWQWLFKIGNDDRFILTTKYYKCEGDVAVELVAFYSPCVRVIEPYEPSMIEVEE